MQHIQLECTLDAYECAHVAALVLFGYVFPKTTVSCPFLYIGSLETMQGKINVDTVSSIHLRVCIISVHLIILFFIYVHSINLHREGKKDEREREREREKERDFHTQTFKVVDIGPVISFSIIIQCTMRLSLNGLFIMSRVACNNIQIW